MSRCFIIAFIFFIFSPVVQAQTLSLEELVELSMCKEKKCCDGVLNKTGFTFYMENSVEATTSLIYTSGIQYKLPHAGDLMFKNVASFTIITPNNMRISSIVTADKKYYDSFMKEIENSPYNRKMSSNIDNGKLDEYTSERLLSRKIQIYSTAKEAEGVNYTEYRLEVVHF